MENLVEQVVKKEKDFKYYLNICLLVLAALGIPGVFVMLSFITGVRYLIVVAFFLLLFSIYGLWWAITSLKVDYEYACLSSTLRIDKVIAKRRRKSIVKFDIKSVTNFFPYDDKEMGKRKIGKVFRASAKEFSEENYVMIFRHEARGECALIFTPNEKMLEAIKPFFSAEMKKKLYFGKQS